MGGVTDWPTGQPVFRYRKIDQNIDQKSDRFLAQTGFSWYALAMEPTTMLLIQNPANGSQWWSGPYLVSSVPGVIKQYAGYGYLIKDAG